MTSTISSRSGIREMAANRGTLFAIRRSVVKWIFRQALRFTCKIEISGLENIPTSGAYLIAHNHVSLIEPALVLSFWPSQPEVLATAKLWETPGLSIVARWYGATPVVSGGYGRVVLQKMIALLEQGASLVIAPEGMRTHTPGMVRAQPGISYLIERAGVPIVPVGIIGATNEALSAALRLRRPRIAMRVGAPFELPLLPAQGKARREGRQLNADRVLRRVAKLLPEEYRGFYGGDELPTETRESERS